MQLDLRGIIELPGGKVAFDFTPDISKVIGGSIAKVKEPARAKGYVVNSAGILKFQSEIETVYLCVCARCLKEFDYPVKKAIEAIITEHGDGEDPDGYFLQGDSIDAEDIIVSELILSTENIILCKDDCAGLCHICGADLNKRKCDCRKETDPRLKVLEKLLK